MKLLSHYWKSHLWSEFVLTLGWSCQPDHVTPSEPIAALRPLAFAVWDGGSSWQGWTCRCGDGGTETGCTVSRCLTGQTDFWCECCRQTLSSQQNGAEDQFTAQTITHTQTHQRYLPCDTLSRLSADKLSSSALWVKPSEPSTPRSDDTLST